MNFWIDRKHVMGFKINFKINKIDFRFQKLRTNYNHLKLNHPYSSVSDKDKEQTRHRIWGSLEA